MCNFLLFALVGYPLWLVTTSVYRCELPAVDSIKANELLRFPLNILVHLEDGSDSAGFSTDSFKSALNTKLSQIYQNHRHGDSFLYFFDVTVKEVTQATLNDPFESILVKVLKGSEGGKNIINILTNNTIIVEGATDSTNDHLADLISAYVRTSVLKKSSVVPDGLEIDTSAKAIPFKSKVLLSFNLMNGDTENVLVDWDIETAINRYVMPFARKIGNAVTLQITSQVQDYAHLKVEPVKKSGYYQVPHGELSQFVNTAEWNLAMASNLDAELNFILYVPSRKHSPLRIALSENHALNSSSFLLPRAGGVSIFNLKSSLKKEKAKISVDELGEHFNVFIYQLRQLLGIEDLWSEVQITEDYKIIVEESSIGLSDWELCAYLRRKTAENAVTASDTLTSLVRMIEKLQNMVVNDNIADMTAKSLFYLNSVIYHPSNTNSFSFLKIISL
jgi:phosphatidylinositol glycan class S